MSDDRRRRLLQEEVAGSPSAPTDTAAADKTARASGKQSRSRYALAADMSDQPRVTDLAPSRKSTLFVLFLLGLAVLGGLLWLYVWMPAIASQTNDGRVAAFDLDGEGSLASWYSSALLALAGCLSVLIFSLRRHRLDDYRAKYRVWLAAACCWFIMSIDESGSLHEGFKELMTYATGRRLYGDGSVWWVMAYGAVLSLIGLRLLLDMSECRFAALTLLLCAACFGVAVATQLKLLLPHFGVRAILLEEGLEMLGGLLLLLSLAVYARHVIREIQGHSPRGGKPAKRQKPAKKGQTPQSAEKSPASSNASPSKRQPA